MQLGFAQAATVGYNTAIVSSVASSANLNKTIYDGQSSGGALNGASVPEDNFFVLPVIGGEDSGTYAGWKPSGTGANAYAKGNVPPVYGGVIDRHDANGNVIGYDLVYAFFFAYNGLAMLDPGIGVHEGDLEHVVARVDADKKTLIGVYYRQHAGDDPYNGWYYPPGPDTPEAGGILFETYTAQRCIVYCAQGSHASYPRQADVWLYLRGRDVVDRGFAWDTAQNVVVMNDPAQSYWLDYVGRFGAAPTARAVFSSPPSSPICQGWQNEIASGPFIEREIYCQELPHNSSRVSAGDFFIAQVPLSWTFDDPNGWLSSAQLARVKINLSHDVKGQDCRAITGITSGSVTNPPYAHTDNVYFSSLQYTDANGKTHTGYADTWQAMRADSTAPASAQISFRIVCAWTGPQDSARPQTATASSAPQAQTQPAAATPRAQPSASVTAAT
ncbi:MAG TPA: Vps62-related protein [Polyangiaceae bacterium]|nr:Vps62-related protein [Polyangiaceae bacterium]